MAIKKAITLNVDAREAVEAALREVNGRATAFTVTAFAEVVAIAANATKLLDRRDVRIADRAGVTVTFRPAGPSANRYKYSAPSTLVTLRLASDGKTWRLAAVEADTVFPRSGETFAMSMTPAAHARYLEARAKDFGIIRPAVVAPVAEAEAA